MSKGKRIAISIGGVLAIVLIAGIVIWRLNSNSTSVEKAYVDKVSTLMELGSGNGSVSRFSGVVQSQQTWEAKADSTKTVKKIKVEEGDTVKAGQTLFTYDVTDAKQELNQLKLELEQVNVEISGYNDEVKTLQESLKATSDKTEKASIRVDIQSKQNDIKQAQYDKKSKQQEIKSKTANVKVTKVKSEIAGIVQKVNNSMVGSDSSDGDTSSSDAVVTILSTGNYRVKAVVNEQNVEEVEKGKTAVVYSRTNSDKKWSGTVTSVDQEGVGTGTDTTTDATEDFTTDSGDMESDSSGDGTTTSTSYNFYVGLEASEGLLLGQHVYVEMDYGQGSLRKGVWLDSAYIKDKKGKPYVWKIGKNKKLTKQEVKLGEYNKDLSQYEIKKGLSMDDGVAFPQSGFAEGIPCSWN